jgi:nucleoside-diphosphate-sugar epimerase
MRIEINGSGDQMIDLVHAADVADVLVEAINGPYGTVVEAGSGVATRVQDAALDIIEACKSKSRIVHVSGRAGEPEGAVVVAENPACSAEHAWPWRVPETVAWYQAQLAAKGML